MAKSLTSPNPKPALKLFWMLILFGLLCAAFGGALAWMEYAAARGTEERSGWVSGQALLYEVGIRWTKARHGSNYDMTARYVVRVDGRDYEGSEIARGYSSQSAVDVRSLIVSYAPEAAAYSFEDLGVLNPQRNWNVAYRPVAARYDPLNPAHSQMLLDKPIVIKTVGNWVARGMATFSFLTAAFLWVFAWPAARGRNCGEREYNPPAGPALREYPLADRRRMLERIEKVHAEISRLSAPGWTGEMRYYAERIERMVDETRDGSFVPLHYTNLQLGRGADEVFGDSKLVNAAHNVQTCIDELVKQPPGSGRTVST